MLEQEGTVHKSVYVELGGCTRRLLELEKIRNFIISNNYRIVNNPRIADYIILGTCAFKEKEERVNFGSLLFFDFSGTLSNKDYYSKCNYAQQNTNSSITRSYYRLGFRCTD